MEIAGFMGEVLEPSDEGFETVRQIWNGDIQRRPAIIARCTGTADVLAAVRFARERELPMSIRGGGHAVAGHAVGDGGLMIDLATHDRRAGRPAGENRPGPRGLPVAPRRPREPGLRASGDRRHRHPYRDRRVDPRRRDRPPHAQLRAHHRQPRVLRPDHRRWRVTRGERGGASRSVLGPAGRRWQLRSRHVLQVPAALARSDSPRRPACLAHDGSGGRTSLPPRLCCQRARRGRDHGEPAARTGTARLP